MVWAIPLTMVQIDDTMLIFLGAIALGILHGAEPGHGWPIAATYALDRERKWLHGFAASFLLGVGHLISSIAMVAVFFFARDYFNLMEANTPYVIMGFEIGGPISVFAGVMLILLGIREYRQGHGDGHSHGDGGHAH